MFEKFNEVVFSVTRLDVLLWVMFWFALLNLLGAGLVYFDKQSSINNKRRISEKTLLIIAGLGGAIGEYLVMHFVRHKTLHQKFMVGLPLIFSAQICIFVWWLFIWF